MVRLDHIPIHLNRYLSVFLGSEIIPKLNNINILPYGIKIFFQIPKVNLGFPLEIVVNQIGVIGNLSGSWWLRAILTLSLDVNCSMIKSPL